MVTLNPIITGEQLRIQRVIHRMSQTELANLLNVTRNTIARWERLESISDVLSFDQMKQLNEIFEETLQ